MKSETFLNITQLYKKLINLKNSLNVESYLTDKNDTNKVIIQDLIANLTNTLNSLEQSFAYFDASDSDYKLTSDWLNNLNNLIPENEKLSFVLENQSALLAFLKKIRDHFSRINRIEEIDENTYVNLTNNLHAIKIESDTNALSRITNLQIKDIKNELSKTKDSYEAVNKIYDDIKEKNENFSILIDSENNTTLKKLYDEIYSTENVLANSYRRYAIVNFGVVGILVLLIILAGIFQNIAFIYDPKSYTQVKYEFSHLIRFLGIFSLTIPAWYFSKESSRHRLVAYKAKILGTELAAFPHYVKELSNEERINMRKDLAEKFFGQELYTDKNNNATASVEQSKVTVDALKTVTSLLSGKGSSSGSGSPP